ncbi:MAG: hypothetical protein AVDCRST_MAG11-964 [uncultured Gemmatimonadaceae bacterium]|uniref:Soluble ligand binding domain-containing protein n=1 Tax=uncultured Gemmatimonadaceae bacterium TaxID=246130 RepID=A0A6J4KDT8_9BACT|nr:MAG: hypothetical protein AVDCRST_MAG11-964 [uncultured Gemmatimonadaceae bacterium]
MNARSSLRPLLCAAFLLIGARVGGAQQPSAADAQALLSQPGVADQLRQRLGASGLSGDQIRDRLRAEGYSESLLDSYLPGGQAAPAAPANSAEIVAAVRSLGIVDSTEAAQLQATLRPTVPIDPALQATPGPVAPPPRDTTPPPAPPSDTAVFGREVFARAGTVGVENPAGPVDESYRLGPGDRLVLILTGDVEAAYTLDVTREGFVVIPQVGQLPVANLTLGQLEDLLYSRLGRAYSGLRRGAGATTRFSVSLARLRTNRVFLVGDVARPGAYQVPATATAFTALYQAGGPSANGTLRRIEIRRGGRTVDVLDVYDYLLRGDASRDVRLQSGDVVFVPVRGAYVRVTGEVIRPATYELKPGETLASVVQAAGGFTATAGRTRVQIDRILPPTERGAGGRDRVTIDVASRELATGSGPAFTLQAGDVIRVFPIATRVRNRVTVLGNVWSPGSQGFTGPIRLSDALRLAGGVKPDTYLGRVLITRLRPDSTRVQLRAALRDTTGAAVEDVALQEDDEVRVFSLTDFRPERYVAITGAVRTGGRFPYRDGMTVRDLVLLAGGMQESAYLREAEVARLPESRVGGVTATTLRVPLDSTYLFERDAAGRYLGPPGLAAPRAAAPEVPLLPYDNVLILQQPDWELQRNVTIGGEVRFPGTYAVLRKNERLSDLIARAGGLTSEAYAGGTVFTRQRNKVGRIGLDVPRVLRDRRHVDNLLLQDGDSVFVPRFNAVVTVKGAVNAPLTVAFAPGQDLGYYVRAAGGPAGNADIGRAFVTQANGKVESVQRRRLLPDGVPTPRAGSTVTVPARQSGLGTLAVASQVSGILSAAIPALLAVVAYLAGRN